MDEFCFAYCQKLIVFSSDEKSVLLCKRKGEVNFNETFSLIGGKLQMDDESIVAGLKREKDEDVGENFKIKFYPTYTINLLHTIKNGSRMVLPHYYAIHIEGDIKLNKEEYSEYRWVSLDEIETFEPKIDGIPQQIQKILELKKIIKEEDFTII